MLRYSPSTTTAWASIHYMQQSSAGALVRGLHHWGSQALILVFVVHTILTLVVGAFRAPRELIWITGVLVIPLLAVWIVSGNPLAGTQTGFAQIEVETGILGSTPVLGPILQQIVVGGDRVGNLTLTHMYALHVVVLPLLVGLLLAVHLSQVYRHGVSAAGADHQRRMPVSYWPHQTVRNMVLLGVVLGCTAVLAWQYGAPLDVPADPELPHSPRPEWYFLFLFELRSYFGGPWEFVATAVAPGLALLVLLAMPWIDRAMTGGIGTAFRWLLVVAGVVVWVALTAMSVAQDRQDEQFLASRARSAALATRARVLADQQGVPPEGAAALLRQDPQTQGPILFASHCAACHSHVDRQGRGIAAAEPTASNLYGFATRQWIVGLLDPDGIRSPQYFGNTAFADGDMATMITGLFDMAKDEAEKSQLRKQLALVATALAAEAGLPTGQPPADDASIAEGRRLLTDELGCIDCHRFHDVGELGLAPDLTGYGSAEWLLAMISNPQHERFYGDRNDRMPAFAHSQQPEQNVLSPRQLQLLIDWLRGQWYHG